MHDQPISVPDPSQACIFCKRTIPPGGTVWRGGHPHHAECLARILAGGNGLSPCPTLRRGLLPAGKDRYARRTDLYKNHSATAEVGGDA